MIEIGRICIKNSGRDKGNICLIIDVIDEKTVLIDGNVRRKKSNIRHITPTEKIVELQKNASHEHVLKILESLDYKTKKKSIKERKTKEPVKVVKENKLPKATKPIKKTKKEAKK